MMRKNVQQKFKNITLLFVWLMSLSLVAQNITVTGTITDATFKEPVIGATIIVEGNASQGTVTDIDGNFTLPNVPESATLIVSYVGYAIQKASVKGQNVINVVLSQDTELLDEIVVTGYGGTQNRSKLTTSISSIKDDNFKSGLFTNAAQALSGAVAGLRIVQTSGNPGSSPSIVLRGGTNLDGSGSPLIIIDGQLRDNLSDINPEVIESMEVLKDAGATALYGARASNGVILVTTKSGKADSGTIGVKVKMGLNYFNSPYDFMNAGDYLYWMRTAYQRSSQIFKSTNGEWVGIQDLNTLSQANAYGTGNIYWDDKSTEQIPANGLNNNKAMWSPMVYKDDLNFLLDQGWNTMIDPVFGDKLIYKERSTDKDLRDPAISQDYNINLSGGSDKGSYYTNIGYNKTEGQPINLDYERISILINSDYKIKKWLTSYTNASLTQSKRSRLPNGRDATKINEDHFFTSVMSMPPTSRTNNPSSNLHINKDKYESDIENKKMNFTQSLKVDILRNLNLKLNAMWLFNEDFNEIFNKDIQMSGSRWNRERKSSAFHNSEHRQTYNTVLDYSLKHLNRHNLNVMTGFEYHNQYKKGFFAEGSGAPTEDFKDLELTSSEANMRNIDSWHENQRIMSYFGKIDYDFLDKYLLSATFRTDGYSILSDESRWGTFPGISAGWILNKEDFMENFSSIISFAKLRASYGTNGNAPSINQGFGAYDLQGKYITYPYNGIAGYLIGSLPNPKLRWEKSYTTDIGLDISFLENKINANFIFYNRNTKDKYADIPMPGSSGINIFRTNNGQIRNRGFEADIDLRIINNKDWTWNINLNTAYNKNKIIKLPDNGLERNRQNAIQVYDPSSPKDLMWVGGYQEGQEPGILYAFKAEGIYKTEDEIPGNLIDKTSGDNGSNGLWLYGPTAWENLSESEKIQANGRAASLPIQPGDVKWKDINNDGVIDDYDMVKIGSTTPRWVGGINSAVKYKNISFAMRMDYGLGFKILDSRAPWIMGNMVGFYNTIEKTKDTWSTENPNGNYPMYTWADQLGKRNYARPSSLFINNGNYLAFREVSITYSLPNKWLEKVNINSLDLNITGQNLGYITAAKTVHSPETSNPEGIWAGSDKDRSGGYPLPRTFIFGINLNF